MGIGVAVGLAGGGDLVPGGCVAVLIRVLVVISLED